MHDKEYIAAHIRIALDLLQMITDDLEANFLATSVDSGVKARAVITISALNTLSDYLQEAAG